MSPADTFLQRFIVDMRPRVERIRRACYAKEVVFTRTSGRVVCTVRWENKDGTEGAYERVFSLEELLGDTRFLHPHAWQLQPKHCTCAQAVIAGALGQRGVV